MKLGLVFVLLGCIYSRAAEIEFPKAFKWGVAASAHQTEGDNVHSDWWEFEQAGNIKNKQTSGKACDHWNLYKEDTRLIKSLNATVFRFSIEWAKIEPREGEYDQSALDHYAEVAKHLISEGITPLVTLHHFTLPNWVASKGGWENPDSSKYFEAYSKKVAESLKDFATEWITFNEPTVLITAGYFAGLFPPQKTDIQAGIKALRNILRAHAGAYHAIHKVIPHARVGFAHHLRIFDPANKFNPMDHYMAKQLDTLWNWSLINATETGKFKFRIPFVAKVNEKIEGLKGTQDFLGINYYSRDLVKFSRKNPWFILKVKKGAPVNDLGWEIYPKGLYRLLINLHKKVPKKPILITENGLADSADKQRINFIRQHLKFTNQAMRKGVPVEGYLYWSLTDNFEWLEGFDPRFGLFEMNYATQERKPRESATFFSEVARTGKVSLE